MISREIDIKSIGDQIVKIMRENTEVRIDGEEGHALREGSGLRQGPLKTSLLKDCQEVFLEEIVNDSWDQGMSKK